MDHEIVNFGASVPDFFGDSQSDTAPRRADEAAADEMSDVLKQFKASAKNENLRMEDATDGEFWLGVVFQSKAQRDEFIAKLGVEVDDQFIDGMALADQIGIILETPVMPVRQVKIDKAWQTLI